MQRLIFFLMLTACCGHTAFAQPNLPIIKATDVWVDLRVGDELFIKHGWRLQPENDPDIFSIGSKLPYEHKRVSFITNVDSISFDVQPGAHYDFIVLLNNTSRCHVQIVTSPDPVFLDTGIVTVIVSVFIVVIVILYSFRKKINTTWLLSFGYIAPVAFWITTLVSGYIHGHYNHAKNVISELGALGTRSEVITSTSLVLIAIMCVLFSVGFYRASRRLGRTTIPSVLSFAMPMSLVWAAIFPLGNEFHSATGPLPLLVILGSLVGFLGWRDVKAYASVRLFSLISLLIMLLLLLRFTGLFGRHYEGLVQRFFYVGWTLWYVSVSFFFIRPLRQLNASKANENLHT